MIPEPADAVRLVCGDCLDLLRGLPDDSVDLVMCSPPYEAQRLYAELQFRLEGQEWVDWAAERFRECVRVCRGLVCWVVEGYTSRFRWSASPMLLAADLHRAGVRLRKPPIFRRRGIPGSGGPDYVGNFYEFCITASKGRLPFWDVSAYGTPPKFGPGGPPSHRNANGDRVNGSRAAENRTNGKRNDRIYIPPQIANPGNVIDCGPGGRIGSDFAHKNEAPFPLSLAEFFVRSFAPPGGLVLDCFSGSGTTGDAAKRHGRRYLGFDVRQSQIDLATERLGGICWGQGSPPKKAKAKRKPKTSKRQQTLGLE